MGILNVTPDSFFDGGKYFQLDSAITQSKKMIDEGATIIDVGGESSRPFSKSISVQEEIKRGYEVLKSLSQSDVGQSVAVQNGLVLSLEAIEGTDEMIKRAGKLKFSGLGPILVKAPKINQDMRFDQPVIGEQTIENAYKSGFSGIACKHKNVLIINLEKVIKLAEKRQITLFGF